MVEQNIEDAIINYTTENESDLLVVTTYTTTLLKRMFHHSVTKELMFHMQIPLLVFNRTEY